MLYSKQLLTSITQAKVQCRIIITDHQKFQLSCITYQLNHHKISQNQKQTRPKKSNSIKIKPLRLLGGRSREETVSAAWDSRRREAAGTSPKERICLRRGRDDEMKKTGCPRVGAGVAVPPEVVAGEEEEGEIGSSDA